MTLIKLYEYGNIPFECEDCGVNVFVRMTDILVDSQGGITVRCAGCSAEYSADAVEEVLPAPVEAS